MSIILLIASLLIYLLVRSGATNEIDQSYAAIPIGVKTYELDSDLRTRGSKIGTIDDDVIVIRSEGRTNVLVEDWLSFAWDDYFIVVFYERDSQSIIGKALYKKSALGGAIPNGF